MKKNLLLSLVLACSLIFIVQPAFSSTFEKIEECGDRDAKCVGKVLLEKLNELQLGTPSNLVVDFYNSDHCNQDLLTTINFGTNLEQNRQRCEARAQYIKKNVWGVRYNGECIDIRDTNFLAACEQFI